MNTSNNLEKQDSGPFEKPYQSDADLARAIETAIRSICAIVCTKPSDIKYRFSLIEDALLFVEIETCQDDVRRIIGKGGAMVNAMRTILHAACARFGLRSQVVVKGGDRMGSASPS
jgi:predicted RNA-binding protein YlqC (UPF0109 family)